jgi:hypothetical protein
MSVLTAAVSRKSGAVCRCFGRARTTLSRRHVVRNAFLLAVAVSGLVALSVVDGAGDPAAVWLATVVGAVLVVRRHNLADLVAGPVG